jgi:hypothetical protein
VEGVQKHVVRWAREEGCPSLLVLQLQGEEDFGDRYSFHLAEADLAGLRRGDAALRGTGIDGGLDPAGVGDSEAGSGERCVVDSRCSGLHYFIAQIHTPESTDERRGSLS